MSASLCRKAVNEELHKGGNPLSQSLEKSVFKISSMSLPNLIFSHSVIHVPACFIFLQSSTSTYFSFCSVSQSYLHGHLTRSVLSTVFLTNSTPSHCPVQAVLSQLIYPISVLLPSCSRHYQSKSIFSPSFKYLKYFLINCILLRAALAKDSNKRSEPARYSSTTCSLS